MNVCEYIDVLGKVVIMFKDSGFFVILFIEDILFGIKKGNEFLLFEFLFREDVFCVCWSFGGGLGLFICK